MCKISQKSLGPAEGPGGLLGRPTLSESDVIGAALINPGFSPHDTVWRLTIDRDGLLRQEVRTRNYQRTPMDEFHYGEIKVANEELSAILEVANRIGFRNLSDVYEDDRITDQATLWLAVRFGTGLKTVQAYAPVWWAARGQQEMIAFLELWGNIHRFAPFPSIYNDPWAMVAAAEKIQALMK
jgi:hypothetical protein